MRVFLDTNVFVYAAGSSHPHQLPCAAVLQAVAERRLEAVTSVEVAQELLHLYRRRGLADQGMCLVRDVLDLCEVLPVARRDVLEAMRLIEQHPRLSTRDAIHAATALCAGLDVLVSVDRDFESVSGLLRWTPEKLLADGLS